MSVDKSVAAIAAELYANPVAPEPAVVRAIYSILETPSPASGAEALRFLFPSSHGPDAVAALIRILSAPDRAAALHAVAVDSLRYAIAWTPSLIDPDALLPLVALEHLEPHCQTLAESVLEPSFYYAAKVLTPDMFERFTRQCGRDGFFKYFCYYAAARQDFPPDIRQRAREQMAGRFQHHARIYELLGQGRKRVLVIQNIRDGQGDEIVRCAPLLQAILDFNPELEIALVTGRPYLYGHSRLQVTPIRERVRIEEMLRAPHDAIVDFFEPNVRQVNYDPELQSLVHSHPRLMLSSTKGHNRFVFERFDLDGQPLAGKLALDRQRVANIYETTFRLIAELGMPLRCGESLPDSGPVLAADDGAVTAWTRLTAHNSERRPVALLNPFGGGEALKGYAGRKMDALALEIRALVGEGFYVVLLPNGTPWSKPGLIEQAIARLDAEERKQVIIAPDPAGQSGTHADNTMRLFLSFIRLADLTVTVEGWAVHAAYSLGKRYRILMLPYSHPAEWQPYAATSSQYASVDTPDVDEGPPLPAQPRKFTLLFLLRELGRSGGAEDFPLVARALQSEDREIRLAAVKSLPKFITQVPPDTLLNLLDDTSYRVRGAAAAILLDHQVVAAPPREHLEAYVRMAAEPRSWPFVVQLGDAARAALEAGLDDDDAVIRRESGHLLGLYDIRHGPRPQRNGIGHRLSRLFRRQYQTAEKAAKPDGQTVLILTPVKDACGCIGRYCRRLGLLTYPPHLISIGLLEGDSEDTSFADLERSVTSLRRRFRRVGLWKKDFGYRVPAGVHRGAEEIQVERRTILARSRNHLLFRALDDEDWVLWLDVDVIDYPSDIIELLLAAGKDIVQPHCVLDYGGPTFDRNAWRDRGRLHLDDLRGTGELVELDAVGATMLLVRADLHREGLIFPSFPYGIPNAQVRSALGERETEGLGLMARDMGHVCWGMPNLEIRHRRW